jgi:hypothetical protein
MKNSKINQQENVAQDYLQRMNREVNPNMLWILHPQRYRHKKYKKNKIDKDKSIFSKLFREFPVRF